jgi:cation:H+ antiporter
VLALIAVLPEYAVDALFAFRAGSNPEEAPLALANMTGANRLLIGVGWSLAAIMGALGERRRRASSGHAAQPRDANYALALTRRSAVAVFVLACVSLYTLSFVFRSSLTLVDTVILFGAFAFYVVRLWNAPKEEPKLIGPPAAIAELPPQWRRTCMIAMLVCAGAIIFVTARPFSDALVHAGTQLGIGSFLMVQWIAPLATESAELIPAAIFAYRQNGDDGLGTLLSSKINQWTLLVGGVPIAFAIGGGTLAGIPLDWTQRQELLLTASQSVFAVALLADDLRLGSREAALILVLFAVDLVASVVFGPSLRTWTRFGFSASYLVLSAGAVIRARKHLRELSRNAVRIPLEQLPPTPH